MGADRDTALARTPLHPAVIIIGAFVMASAGAEVWPLDPGWLAPTTVQNIGKGLMIAGFALLTLAYVGMARSRTTIDPRRRTTRIVTAGIYRFSRNPIYLGWFTLMLGAGLEKLSLFYAAISLLMIGVLRWAVVIPEERYLEAAFGEQYLRYKARVRRWL